MTRLVRCSLALPAAILASCQRQAFAPGALDAHPTTGPFASAAVDRQIQVLNWIGIAALVATVAAFVLSFWGVNGHVRRMAVATAIVTAVCWALAGTFAYTGVLPHIALAIALVAGLSLAAFYYFRSVNKGSK